jgi:endonuclease/exonuclease/phosphatase family metal-dependent hydrolase
MTRIGQALLMISVVLTLSFDLSRRPQAQVRRDAKLRVMSYNIRYGTAADGENHWEKRRERLVETIRSFDPDLLGTQETLGFQRDYLARNLPGYEAIGVGRDDGREAGEMTALYFRRERFEKLDGGHFWLSETPDIPGSKSWDTSLTRMASWVRLRDRNTPKKRPIVFINTHFDHRGQQARLESARLLRQRVAALAGRDRAIITGDFNAGEDSQPYQALFDRTGLLLDTFRLVTPQRSPNEGTFSGFKVENVTGPRIDWIAVTNDWRVRAATIDRTAREGRTPSDHFAVNAILESK